ncbi:MAG: CBS domain-containing protein [Clostridiales bacterium]|nr:CBS domain-containing protein [Clostridiales bacterium]
MFVANRMQRRVPTIARGATLKEAVDLMEQAGVEALPVTEEGQVLAGVVTMEQIMAYLRRTCDYATLEKVPVEAVMGPAVSVGADDIIEEAAFWMQKHGVDALPVVDEGGRPIGLITQKILYATLVEMMGLRQRGSRITLFVEDRVGVLAEVAEIVRRHRVAIASLATFVPPDRPRFVQVVVRLRTEEPEPIVEALRREGFTVTHVSQVWE